MRLDRLGQALLDVGSYASGGAVVFLLFCGGAAFWNNSQGSGRNPYVLVIGWAMVGGLVGGLLLMAVGYVLRETVDPQAPDLTARVTALEAEVARLRTHTNLPTDPPGPNP